MFWNRFFINDKQGGKDLFLKVTTYNHVNGLPVEASQCSAEPFLLRSQPKAQSILWLQHFHLQIPLDNLENYSYVIVEVHRQIATISTTSAAHSSHFSLLRSSTMISGSNSQTPPPPPASECIAWCKLILDRSIIDSTPLTTPLFCPPLHHNALNPDLHSSLEMELIIARR